MRTYRAGDAVDELCRSCKIDRLHTVIVADAAGRPVRVQCDYCGSQHNSRGMTGDVARGPVAPRAGAAGSTTDERIPLPPASEREGLGEAMMAEQAGPTDLEMMLRRVIREEAGVTPAVPAEKWRGGTLVLKPGNASLQEKSWPIDTFFHKIVMIRNRLRTFEQHVNAMDLPEDVKIRLQSYITGCYGTLTSFNVLFADERDQFKGAGGD